MASQSKTEKVKIWLKEYLSEFGEYTGTLEELSQLADSTPYLVKKALAELEKELIIKSESKRGKGLVVSLINKEESEEDPSLTAQEPEVQEVKDEEETKESTETKEDTKKKKKEKKPSLQDQVLSSLIGKEVTVFLISGTRLEGVLLDFDNFTLSMTAPKGKSLVYKHAVATIIYE
ncbi:MAG: RNA chaperone Hfq [Desulfurobacteriaceae bacterium]